MKEITSILISIAFLANSMPSMAMPEAFGTGLTLPDPGIMVSVSPSFEPALIKGLTVHQDNPFLFDFIVDPSQSKLSKEELKNESERMIRYFFAALTIPDNDIWVNLSPYEKDRMVPQALGETAMGRDLLAQDYLLKQLTASLIYPQKALGKTFWTTLYAKAKAMYGTTQIPVNTFNKVWIVPEKAGVYEHGQTAFIVSGHLKVMLEQDYLSMAKHSAVANPANVSLSGANQLSSQIIRQVVLPEIDKEINEGKNFATLRQIFYAQVLAVWFKRNLKQALLNRVYANKGTVKGIDDNGTAANEVIYHQYLKAYRKGVFNFIQEESFPALDEEGKGGMLIPRKYFSGGYGQVKDMAMTFVPFSKSVVDAAQGTVEVETFVATTPKDAAVLAKNAKGAAEFTNAAMMGKENVSRVIVEKGRINDLIEFDEGSAIWRTSEIPKKEYLHMVGRLADAMYLAMSNLFYRYKRKPVTPYELGKGEILRVALTYGESQGSREAAIRAYEVFAAKGRAVQVFLGETAVSNTEASKTLSRKDRGLDAMDVVLHFDTEDEIKITRTVQVFERGVTAAYSLTEAVADYVNDFDISPGGA